MTQHGLTRTGVHSRDLGQSLCPKTRARAKCRLTFYYGAGALQLFPGHVRAARALPALLCTAELFLLLSGPSGYSKLCHGRAAAWSVLSTFNFYAKFWAGAKSIIGAI